MEKVEKIEKMKNEKIEDKFQSKPLSLKALKNTNSWF